MRTRTISIPLDAEDEAPTGGAPLVEEPEPPEVSPPPWGVQRTVTMQLGEEVEEAPEVKPSPATPPPSSPVPASQPKAAPPSPPPVRPVFSVGGAKSPSPESAPNPALVVATQAMQSVTMLEQRIGTINTQVLKIQQQQMSLSADLNRIQQLLELGNAQAAVLGWAQKMLETHYSALRGYEFSPTVVDQIQENLSDAQQRLQAIRAALQQQNQQNTG